MTSLEGYMVQAMVVCIFIFILFFWAWRLKGKYQRQAIDHVLGEFVTKEGTSYTKLLRVEGGLVELPEDEGKSIKGKTFPVAEKCSYLSDYPEGFWCPRFLKCKIKKVVFREFDLEPISNIYDNEIVITPEVLYNIRREKVTEIGARIAQERAKEMGLEKVKKFKLGSASTWLFLLLAAGIIGCIIYIVSQASTIDQLKSALGIA